MNLVYVLTLFPGTIHRVWRLLRLSRIIIRIGFRKSGIFRVVDLFHIVVSGLAEERELRGPMKPRYGQLSRCYVQKKKSDLEVVWAKNSYHARCGLISRSLRQSPKHFFQPPAADVHPGTEGLCPHVRRKAKDGIQHCCLQLLAGVERGRGSGG